MQISEKWQQIIGYSSALIIGIAFPPSILIILAGFLILDWRKKRKEKNAGTSPFGVSFFSNKVAQSMFRLGYPANQMPPIKVFKPLCDALKVNGYDAGRAAALWVKCLRDNDPEAIKELKSNTGAYGIILFEPDKEKSLQEGLQEAPANASAQIEKRNPWAPQ